MTNDQLATLIYQNTGRILHLEDTIHTLKDPAPDTPTPDTTKRFEAVSQRFDDLSNGFKEALHRHHDTTTVLLQTKYETTNVSIADLYRRIHDLASQVVDLKAQLALRPPQAPFTITPITPRDPTEKTDS